MSFCYGRNLQTLRRDWIYSTYLHNLKKYLVMRALKLERENQFTI